MVRSTKAAGPTRLEPLAVDEGGHHDTSTAATAPLLPSAVDIDAIVERASRIAAKRVFRQLMVGLVLLIPELVAVALAGAATRELKRVKALPDETHVAVIVMIISVVAEVMWLCLALPILYCCSLPRGIMAISIGFLGAAAVGVSVYMFSVVGPHLRNGTCDGDKYEQECYRGLTKSIAAGCVRVLAT
ncbi:hypothetical protein C8A01DRAFT_39477 [Parachaetomium inaequale]|uniref:Uncharacterized protein n=1 Tax=Parachaetomium inaequale TaxID=2588326 RepID=A0AAN6SNT1_9PEZI|nr:hypothetical protein C8A01DRAFT_39477 [Parachaetomium inaequale]